MSDAAVPGPVGGAVGGGPASRLRSRSRGAASRDGPGGGAPAAAGGQGGVGGGDGASPPASNAPAVSAPPAPAPVAIGTAGAGGAAAEEAVVEVVGEESNALINMRERLQLYKLLVDAGYPQEQAREEAGLPQLRAELPPGLPTAPRAPGAGRVGGFERCRDNVLRLLGAHADAAACVPAVLPPGMVDTVNAGAMEAVILALGVAASAARAATTAAHLASLNVCAKEAGFHGDPPLNVAEVLPKMQAMLGKFLLAAKREQLADVFGVMESLGQRPMGSAWLKALELAAPGVRTLGWLQPFATPGMGLHEDLVDPFVLELLSYSLRVMAHVVAKALQQDKYAAQVEATLSGAKLGQWQPHKASHEPTAVAELQAFLQPAYVAVAQLDADRPTLEVRAARLDVLLKAKVVVRIMDRLAVDHRMAWVRELEATRGLEALLAQVVGRWRVQCDEAAKAYASMLPLAVGTGKVSVLAVAPPGPPRAGAGGGGGVAANINVGHCSLYGEGRCYSQRERGTCSHTPAGARGAPPTRALPKPTQAAKLGLRGSLFIFEGDACAGDELPSVLVAAGVRPAHAESIKVSMQWPSQPSQVQFLALTDTAANPESKPTGKGRQALKDFVSAELLNKARAAGIPIAVRSQTAAFDGVGSGTAYFNDVATVPMLLPNGDRIVLDCVVVPKGGFLQLAGYDALLARTSKTGEASAGVGRRTDALDMDASWKQVQARMGKP